MEIEETSLKTKERKKNACPFCDPIALFNCSNYWRHLLRNHPDNIEVERLKSLPKGSSERREILAEIRNKGNFLYNSAKSSLFVPSRRPLKEQSPKKTHYVTCIHCLVLVKRKNFFLHRKICRKFKNNLIECEFCKDKIAEGYLKNHLKNKCPKKDTFTVVTENHSNKSKQQRRVLHNSSVFVSKDLVGASEDLATNVLPLLKLDEIGNLIKSDHLILTVGSKLRSNHKEDHLRTHISSKMRDLAKIVQTMKKMTHDIRGLKDCLKSKNVNLLSKAVQTLCGYDESTGIVKIPSMPGRIKGSIGLALESLKNEIKIDPNLSYETKKELIFDYQTTVDIIKTDWRFIISTNASKSLNEKHRGKGPLLPLEEDVKTISQYLTNVEEELYTRLMKKPDPEHFEQLCEALIADLIVFNGRRSGEVARARLHDYLNRDKIDFEGNLNSVLTESELAAKDSLTMFYVPGKRDRSLPILLTKTMKKCIDLLVAVRNQIQVGNNTLLFPRLYSSRPHDSCKIIRDLKLKVKLKKPEAFTSTGLRHEIATHSHIEDANRPGYKTVLVSHMGHTENVHNAKYVIPMPILQVSKVGANLLQRRLANNQPGNNCNNPTIEDTESNGKVSAIQSDSVTNVLHFDEDKDPDFIPSEGELDETPKKKKKPQGPLKSRTRIPWTFEQQLVVCSAFKEFFLRKCTPGKQRCLELISKNDCLQLKNWTQINAFVENVNKGRKHLPPQLAALIN